MPYATLTLLLLTSAQAGGMADTPPSPEAVEAPAVEQPALEQPALEQPALEQPALEQPALEQPALEQPALEQAAEAAYQACRVAREGDVEGAEALDRFRRCLDEVREVHPHTEAALKAEAALDALAVPVEAVPAPPPMEGEEGAPVPAGASDFLPSFLAPGRLELAFVSGVLGVWSGGTAGILVGTNADQMHLSVEPWMLVLGTGTAAVASGVAGAAAGYLVAEGFDLSQGHVWSFAAGTTWGTSYATSFIPALYDVVEVPWYLQDELILLTPLFGAGLGAATGLGLGLVLDPTIAEVSMMNTGGWIGGALGLMLGLNIGMWTDGKYKPALTTAITYSLLKTSGLFAGALAAKLLDLTWGETLMGDFGAGLGGILLGSLALAFLISPAADPVGDALGLQGSDRSNAMFSFATGSVAAGLGAGIGVATLGLFAWHAVNKRPILRLDELPFSLNIGPPAVALDSDMRPTVGLPTVLVTW